jgi:transcriptional regulator with PAS, ATPase and Fis domain
LNIEEFLASVRTVLLLSRSRTNTLPLGPGTKAPPIIGNSDGIKRVKEIIHKVAGLDSTILILGESGSGKGLVASNIHYLSPRSSQIFIPVNCGAIPDTLLESELFGHERGAFTGAAFRKMGLFEAADKGTMFLDEIGEMSPMLQIKLLRVLEDKNIRSVGSVRDVSIDVRIITATNKDLKSEVKNKKFREDLYYRLNVVPISVPPLRERQEDIPLLVNYFLEKYNLNVKISEKTMQVLRKYSWPGNIRELENVLVRSSILNKERELAVESLSPEIRYAELQYLPSPNKEYLYKKAKTEFEKKFFSTLLDRVDGDVAEAAKLADVSKSYIYNIIKKHKIAVPIE